MSKTIIPPDFSLNPIASVSSGDRLIGRPWVEIVAAAGGLALSLPAPARAGTVLVESIIDSTKTDNPPRFCWQEQVGDGGGWCPVAGNDPKEYRDGHRGCGADFT